MPSRNHSSTRPAAPSTVGRGKAITLKTEPEAIYWADEYASVWLGDSLELYEKWNPPTVIVSDGGYGLLGFEGDTPDHQELANWYEPHVAAWAAAALPSTTLWFWNSEIGWAAVHPVLEKHGWRYENANVWNKGKAHIAGNINTQKIRRFPVVTELCVQYTFGARVNGQTLQDWLIAEWKRSGLPFREANKACGVADAATRKYFDRGHLWYFPPPEMFEKLAAYANDHGRPEGRPYFSLDGSRPGTATVWASMRAKFYCPHGVTNVWDRNPLNSGERFRVEESAGRAVHLNQKPLDLMIRIIEASSDAGNVVWEPFGGLFTGCVAARRLRRRAFAGEIDPTYFQYGVERLKGESTPLL